jgi:TnpA family transposase
MSSYLSRFIGADRLPRNLPAFDIDVYFRLPADTIQAIRDRFHADRLPGVENRMVAMAAQIVFLRTTGRALDNAPLLPPALLRALGGALQVQPPSIASLRSIYKRRETASEHQRWARRHLGIVDASKDMLAQLSSVLSTHAGDVASIDELVTAGAHWLYDQKVLIPADRALRDLARDAFAGIERAAVRTITAVVPVDQRQACRKALFATRGDAGMTVLEWLKTPPRRHSPSTLNETLAKIDFLKMLHVHEWDLLAIPLARQRAYAQAIAGRPPSESRRRKDNTQLLEVICFLRMTLLDLTDSALFQAGRRIGDFSRQASGKTQSRQAQRSGDYRAGLASIKDLVSDATRTPEQRLAAITEVLDALGDLSPNSHAAVVREALSDDPVRVHSLLSAVSNLEFRGRPNDRSLNQLQQLRQWDAAGVNAIPADQKMAVSKVWDPLVNASDRRRAFRALEACTALELRKGLRRGSIWIDHSLTFREREQMLIPRDQWEHEKSQYLSALSLPADPDAYVNPILKLIEAGLAAVVEAKNDGAVSIDAQGMLRLPAMDPLPDEVEPQRLRDLIYRQIGSVQFPDLILDIDALVNFSEVLLGRRAVDEHELVAVYAALFAHGTEIDAKSVAAMIPQLDPGHVAAAMRALESPGRLQRANRRVVEFQRQHAIAALWGTGSLGSSDMMSIDASRNLWNARVDPRRRTYAVGVYTHLLDHHGIVYNQPVVLNERQAGPAIEGVVQHNATNEGTRLQRLAVDTHGYTYPGMTFAKLLGFDLCPRLKNLAERKLFLPRRMDTPEGLERVVIRDVSLKAIRTGWDEMMRVAASILSGRVSATVMLQRLGSAADDDPVRRAADPLGRLLRTAYLCDYFSNPAFRREIYTVLNRGESVHQLQRTVYTGKIAPERGRRRDELVAISGAHTLLTNVVVAWNTHRMQAVVDRWRKAGQTVEDTWLARMGPAHSSHINFRGLFRFGIDRYREMLIQARSGTRRSA